MSNQNTKVNQTAADVEGKSKNSADQPGFLASHFGNPDSENVYGDGGNDYETEPEMIKEERTVANQAIWFTGAFLLLVGLGYLFFG